MDFVAVFSNPQAWVELGTLTFLELVLGIDNLVFIAITSDRLPDSRKSLGRKLGLGGALIMRVILLCCVSWLMSLTTPLFSLGFIGGEAGEITAHDLIMIAGGAYLVYKGIDELLAKLRLEEERAVETGDASALKRISLPHAVALIMMMDVIFSLDSVITATGLVNDLPIMILAVMLAVTIMIVFADPISNFINKYPGIKILALTFIFFVGCVLVLEGFAVELNTVMVYYALGFALIVQLMEIKWRYRGVAGAMVALSALTVALCFALPEIFGPEMLVAGLVASGVIVALYRRYELNYAVLKSEMKG